MNKRWKECFDIIALFSLVIFGILMSIAKEKIQGRKFLTKEVYYDNMISEVITTTPSIYEHYEIKKVNLEYIYNKRNK